MIFPVAFLLILLPFTTALPPETTANAADTLMNSGYVAMSLTLNLVSNSLLSRLNSATIFTPPDSEFSNSGQPSHSLLRFHISPLFFSLSTLQSLDSGTGIPTLLSDKHLTITSTSSDLIEINKVEVIGSPIFDDGLLIIYEIESFFDRDFKYSDDDDKPNRKPMFNDCETGDEKFSFHDAGNVLSSTGYSVMASFLNLQLLGFQSQPSLTIFAPVDEVMTDYSSRFPDYASVFLRHVLPCKIPWKELSNIDNGVSLKTYLEGFEVSFTRSGGSLTVNNVPIAFPDMYNSDWLVIHGVPRVISYLAGNVDASDSDDSDSDSGSDSVPNFDNSGKEMKVDATTTRTEF